MHINGWGLYCSSCFDAILDDLIKTVIALKDKDPNGYISHEKSKHLRRIYLAITEDVPQDPLHSKFNLGKNTLGKHRQAWKRVKAGLPERYRLFFKRSTETHTIVYAWVNNSKCLRKDGARTDVYRVFEAMLRKREIAENYDVLLSRASELDTTEEQRLVLQ